MSPANYPPELNSPELFKNFIKRIKRNRKYIQTALTSLGPNSTKIMGLVLKHGPEAALEYLTKKEYDQYEHEITGIGNAIRTILIDFKQISIFMKKNIDVIGEHHFRNMLSGITVHQIPDYVKLFCSEEEWNSSPSLKTPKDKFHYIALTTSNVSKHNKIDKLKETPFYRGVYLPYSKTSTMGINELIIVMETLVDKDIQDDH